MLKARLWVFFLGISLVLLCGCQSVTKYFIIDPSFKSGKSGNASHVNSATTLLETQKLASSELDKADQFYLDGSYEQALAHYQKAMMINPNEEYAIFRIQEIKNWQTKMVQQNEDIKKQMEAENKLIEEQLKEVQAENEKLASDLSMTEKQNTELYLKLDVSKALIRGSIALAENKFEEARKYVRKVLISNPDSKAAHLMWQKIKETESQWLALEKLKQQSETIHKKSVTSEGDQKIQETSYSEEQRVKTTKDIITRNAQSGLEQIMNEEFLYKSIPDIKKKQELWVDHLKEKAITIYQKSIEDYKGAIKTGEIQNYHADELKNYMEDIGKAFIAIAKYDAANKNWQSARENLTTVLENFKDISVLPEAYFLMATLMFDDQKYAQAYEMYESLIDQFPDSEWSLHAYFKMASIRRIENNPLIAIELYQTILDQDKNLDDLHRKTIMLEMANAMAESNHLEDAFVIYDDLLANEGMSSFTQEVQFLKANAILKSQEYQKAREAFTDILTGDPLHLFRAHASFYSALSYFEENLIAQSIIHLKKSFEEFPDFSEKKKFELIYAKALFKASMWDESLKMAENILKSDESVESLKSEALLLSAYIKIKQLLFEEAKVHVLQLLRDSLPQKALKEEAMYVLGEIYFNLKDWGLAAKQFEICGVSFPETSSLWIKSKLYQFKSLRKLGKMDDVKNLGSQFASETKAFLIDNEELLGVSKDEIYKHYYAILFELGDFYFVQKEYDLSISVLKSLVTEYPQSEERVWSEYLIAKAYHEKGDRDQAIKHYESLISGFGSGFWVEQAKFDLNNLRWNDTFKEKAIEIGGRFSANLTS